MTTRTVTAVPYEEKQTVTYDLPNGAPDIHSGSDTLVPTRITINYSQHPSFAIPRVVEVTVKGLFRNSDGTAGPQGHRAEVWRYVPKADRAAWVAVLVRENLPQWWTA
ncbi:hypothetical protein OG455_41760 [Kitasatospora sp. NBC_01287]|uniref:hypothetical protein n=1 Tax=Kitasatospora sp. NBC_01287 TaxID=2903573 RepID=UPI0022510ED8|nr:hypothetical protein [Kitasatospora sp. NBC_01287]MCX4751737.1 hypothetical protein [Kitasatospora sp. NBC_01287]MCX4751971.1 hypothetical protein [Kitasatospora sp. NBC_01287]